MWNSIFLNLASRYCNVIKTVAPRTEQCLDCEVITTTKQFVYGVMDQLDLSEDIIFSIGVPGHGGAL